ncbi:MAG: hypothetical protein AAF725_08215 [Acidobacteriota bacterium]
MKSPQYRRFLQQLDPARSPRSLTYGVAAFRDLDDLEKSRAADELLTLARAGGRSRHRDARPDSVGAESRSRRRPWPPSKSPMEPPR